MANSSFVFVEQGRQLALDQLNWKSFSVEKDYGTGSQTARFEAIIKDIIGLDYDGFRNSTLASTSASISRTRSSPVMPR